MKQLKDDVHHKLYPRRFRIEVVNKDPHFFQIRNYLRFSIFGGENRLRRDVAIAAIGMIDPNTCKFYKLHM